MVTGQKISSIKVIKGTKTGTRCLGVYLGHPVPGVIDRVDWSSRLGVRATGPQPVTVLTCYVYVFFLIIMFMYSYFYACSVLYILFSSCQLAFSDYLH